MMSCARSSRSGSKPSSKAVYFSSAKSFSIQAKGRQAAEYAGWRKGVAFKCLWASLVWEYGCFGFSVNSWGDIKLQRSLTQGGSSFSSISLHGFPASLFSSPSSRFSLILRRIKQDTLSAGFLQTQPVQSLSCQGTLIDRCLIGSCLAPSDKEAMITPFNFGCVFYFYVPLTSLCTLSCFLWLSPKTSVDLLDEVRWSILIENQCQKKRGLLLTLTKTVLYFPYLFLVFLLYFLSLETLRIILLTVLYALILNWSLISTLSLILIPCGCRIEAL